MNAIIIEQNPDEIRLAFEVNQNASIDRIRLARAKVASRGMDEPPRSPIAVMFNFKSKPVNSPDGVMRIAIMFRMAGVEEKEEAKRETKREPVVLVECAYEVDYVLREGFPITPDHVKAFQDGNAVFNAWPYFREYLQNSLQRMGLPPLTAPFLRLQPKPKPRKREKHEDKAERGRSGQGRE
mgnify:CR=1 FL=1